MLPPGPISNNKLYKDNGASSELRPKLKPVAHYRGINDKVWCIYYKIYGGGPIIVRQRVNIYEEALVPPQSALDRSSL